MSRVPMVDWDVPHGNGTQAIYYGRSDCLTISMHQTNFFPPGYSGADERGDGAGAGRNLNVPLPAGNGHETCRHAFEPIPALKACKPELIIVASGLDANAVDPLAHAASL